MDRRIPQPPLTHSTALKPRPRFDKPRIRPEFIEPFDKSSGFDPERSRRIEGRSRGIGPGKVEGLTACEAQSVDAYARDEFGISALVLMENAGRAVAEEAVKALGNKGKVAIVCGKGNNGGDGLVAARHLIARGLEPDVFLSGRISDLKGEALVNAGILTRARQRIVEVRPETLRGVKTDLARYGVIVDALLGVGLEGEVRGIPKDLIDAMNSSRAYIVAVDIPSGLDATGGEVRGAAVKANKTVTFIARKRGMLVGRGPELCGEIVVEDLGLPCGWHPRDTRLRGHRTSGTAYAPHDITGSPRKTQKLNFTPKAVLFDMDGVIVDSMPYHFIAWYEALRPAGIRVSCYDIYAKEGERWEKSLNDFLVKAGIEPSNDTMRRIFSARQKIFVKYFKPYVFCGAYDFLSCLRRKGYSLALVTGTPANQVKEILPKKIARLFSCMVTGDRVANGKPHPEPYLKAAKALRVLPSQCVVVENAPLGIQAAKRAAMFCIALTTSLPREYLAGSDVVVDTLDEVTGVIESSCQVARIAPRARVRTEG